MQPVKILHSSKHVSLFCLPQAGESGGLSGGRTVPTSHCPEARWQDNPGAAATPSRAAVMRGDRAAISDADGHTGGGKGIPRAFMRITTITRLPRSIARHSLRQQGADTYSRGTDGANPSSSSGEPFCEPGSSTEAHHAGTEGSNPASSTGESSELRFCCGTRHPRLQSSWEAPGCAGTVAAAL